MKRIYYTKTLIVLLLAATAQLSHANLGGQSGNGGNGCWTNINGVIEWRSLEELLYPELLGGPTDVSGKPRLPWIHNGEIRHFNFHDQLLASEYFKTLERIKGVAPETYRTLLEISLLFKSSYIIHHELRGVYAGEINELFPKCKRYAPALLTIQDGTIVFFKSTWKKISPKSARIIIIHETLRLAQTFHPGFASMSTKDLQLLTALLLSEEPNFFRLRSILDPIEDTLIRSTYFFFAPNQDENGPETGMNSYIAFRELLMKKILSNQPFAEALNHLRTKNKKFQEAVRKNLRELIRKQSL